jgi:indolepyruvate decarboxylase
LGEELVKWAEKTNVPMFTEMLSKSTVGERHPLFGGVYSGAAAPQHVKDMVEQSDCILMLGVMLTDMVLGSAKPNFALRQTVRANVGCLKVRNHNYSDIVFPEFCSKLFQSQVTKKPSPVVYKKGVPKPFEVAEGNPKIKTQRFFEKIDSIISKNTAIITDVGDCMFGAMDLTVSHANTFISPAYYTSMGMAIPAALGVSLAQPETRPIVLVGDGAFQMSFSEISTLVRRNLNPIIFVLNNKGYTTERFILDGKFNDIHNWDYHYATMVFGGEGHYVETEKELEDAVNSAFKSKVATIINVVVEPKDITPALSRVTAGLASRV